MHDVRMRDVCPGYAAAVLAQTPTVFGRIGVDAAVQRELLVCDAV
jgi:hypothetical protein